MVTVINFQNNTGWVVSDGLRVAVDFNVIENEGLVPRGVEVGLDDLCGLADVQEGHVDIGICEQKINQPSFIKNTSASDGNSCLVKCINELMTHIK